MNERFDKIAPGVPAKLNLFLDGLLAIAALALATGITFSEVLAPLVLVTIGSWFFTAAVLRLYSPCTPRSDIDGVLLGGLGVTGVTTLVGFTHFVIMGDPVPFDVINFGLLFFAMSTLSRLLFVKPFARYGNPSERVLIVGTGPLAKATYERLTAHPTKSFDVIGFLRFSGEPSAVRGAKAPVLGEADQILAVLNNEAVGEVFIAGRVMSQGPQIQGVVAQCEEVGMPFALPLHSVRIERATLLSNSPNRDGYLHYLNTRPMPAQYAVKRVMDIVASSIALFFLSPLLIGTALGIKLTSKGPVLFRQRRVGLHGATFNLLKFRSMVINAEELKEKLAKQNEQTGPVFKMKNDPRITSIGRFIRKYSVDELPQLINILRGDMTIVGPRPAVPKEVAEYKAWQRRRLSVRPGLTCYWQVGGRNEIGFEEWMRLDLRYVDNWNLAIDAQLILQTFPVVLTGRGAS